jgi:hypothetical protein
MVEISVAQTYRHAKLQRNTFLQRPHPSKEAGAHSLHKPTIWAMPESAGRRIPLRCAVRTNSLTRGTLRVGCASAALTQ